MVGLYKKTTIIISLITIVALAFSLGFVCASSPGGIWVSNISIGIISSGFLLIVTSLVSYLREEEHLKEEFTWKLSELEKRTMELETISLIGRTKEQYLEREYVVFTEINSILKSYFAIVDVETFFPKRESIQLILELQNKLYELYKKTNKAVECIRVYLNPISNEKGELSYTDEAFKKDMHDITVLLDDFDHSGKSITLWLREKEREYSRIVLGKK